MTIGLVLLLAIAFYYLPQLPAEGAPTDPSTGRMNRGAEGLLLNILPRK